MAMKNPNHPRHLVRDCLNELGVSVTAGAKALVRETLGAVASYQP